MAEKGWRLLEYGKDEEADDYKQFPFVVMLVNQGDRPTNIYFAPERFATKDQAVARAKFLNDAGHHNVIVFEELAFCIRKESL